MEINIHDIKYNMKIRSLLFITREIIKKIHLNIHRGGGWIGGLTPTSTPLYSTSVSKQDTYTITPCTNTT